MATDITSYVNKIKNAVYGRDVRSSIVSAITKINDDNNKYDALKQEVITARDTTVSTSKKAIDAVNNAKSLISQAETKNTALSNTIKSAGTKDTELKASITKGETLKQDIGTAVKDAMSGDLRLVGDKRSIIFKSGVRENAAITFYKGEDIGGGVVIGDGGRTIIGGGEAAQNLREALGTTAVNESTEELHLANDGSVQIHTNCQTVASRKTFTFGADGTLTAPAGLKGNAATATKLASARKINGQAFDGTADITVADGTKLPLAGGTMTGDLTLSGETRAIRFSSGVLSRTAMAFYKGTGDGSGIVISGGGRTIIGGGESAQNLREALGTTAVNESTEELHLANDGSVQIHTNCQTVASRKTFTFGTDGKLNIPSGTTTGSDRRLKTDIRDISEEAIEAFKQLSPKAFRYIGSDVASIGLIAQDVQETALKDTLVSEGEDGMLAIDYTNLHGLEIALIQSLLAQTETMQKEIEALKERIPDGSAKG